MSSQPRPLTCPGVPSGMRPFSLPVSKGSRALWGNVQSWVTDPHGLSTKYATRISLLSKPVGQWLFLLRLLAISAHD